MGRRNKGFGVNYFFRLAFICALLVFILALGVFAGVNHLTNTIASNYSGGEIIRGNVYLTITDQAANSVLTSNFLGNITLLELIKIQSGLIEGVNYNCSSVGCASGYYSSGGAISSVSLEAGRDSFTGFRVNGPGASITNAKLSVSSNAPSSCLPNIYLDILADGENIITSSRGSGEVCDMRYTGCYDTSNTDEVEIVTGTEYCEKISIPAAPAFIVGGKIRKGSGPSNITMKLYDANREDIVGECKLPDHDPAGQPVQELSCQVNYTASSTKDYYVCLTATANRNHKIGWETSPPTCGTAQGFFSLDSDFDLFAKTIKFSASPSFVINETTYDEMFDLSLSGDIDDYIDNHYGRNCQSSPCFIPIRLYGASQTIGLSDARIDYRSVGVQRGVQGVYELTYEPSKIRANNLSLDISKANFIIPVESSQNKFKLYIDGSQLFQKDISVRRSFAFDVNPKFVAFGQNTIFTANTSNRANITRTIWSFGDGTPQQSVNGSSISHAFTKPNTSSFKINVTAVINQTQATRQFEIFVGDPRYVANQTIDRYKKRIANITSQINSYPSWAVQKIQNLVMLNNITTKLNSIELSYGSASTEEDYQNVMLELIKLDVPIYVSATSRGDNIPLVAGYANFNANYLEEIENKNIADDSSLTDKIAAWMGDNFNSEMSFKKIEIVSDSGTEAIGTLFTIKTNPIGSVKSPVYLIIGQDVKSSGLYKSDYKPSLLTSGVDYITIDPSSTQTFEFFIIGDINAEELGAYIAPSIKVLDITAPQDECNLDNICDENEDADSCPEDCSRSWFKFTFIGWIFLFFAFIIVYIIMQEWYKRNYQKRLFPESNDLFNLINFIYNARKSGLSDSAIKSKLKQQAWSSERIRFAFRKIEGKRVGMLEIPLFTRKEHKEIVRQIASRQPAPLDARFIKRPYYS